MRRIRILSNWKLMVVYTIVLVLGFISACFLLAFYWRVEVIARVDPFAVDYSADNSIALAPLNAQIVASVRRDIGENADEYDLIPIGYRGQEPSSPTPSASATQTLESPTSPTASSTPVSSETPTQYQTATATFTLSPTATNTLVPTQPGEQNTPTPTQKPTKKPTNTLQPNPTATPEPRPTQPPPTATSKPKPTNTKEPYPPPRPYP